MFKKEVTVLSKEIAFVLIIELLIANLINWLYFEKFEKYSSGHWRATTYKKHWNKIKKNKQVCILNWRN